MLILSHYAPEYRKARSVHRRLVTQLAEAIAEHAEDVIAGFEAPNAEARMGEWDVIGQQAVDILNYYLDERRELIRGGLPSEDDL